MNTYGYVEQNPFIFFDIYGLRNSRGHGARLIGRNNSDSQGSVSAGFGGAGHVGPVGLGADSGIIFGTDGTFCIYSRLCGTFGLGIYGNIGITGGLGIGRLCSGQFDTGGFIGAGGAIGAAGLSTEISSSNNVSASRGIAGPGGGYLGGIINCHYTLICFNESPCCNNSNDCECNE